MRRDRSLPPPREQPLLSAPSSASRMSPFASANNTRPCARRDWCSMVPSLACAKCSRVRSNSPVSSSCCDDDLSPDGLCANLRRSRRGFGGAEPLHRGRLLISEVGGASGDKFGSRPQFARRPAVLATCDPTANARSNSPASRAISASASSTIGSFNFALARKSNPPSDCRSTTAVELLLQRVLENPSRRTSHDPGSASATARHSSHRRLSISASIRGTMIASVDSRVPSRSSFDQKLTETGDGARFETRSRRSVAPASPLRSTRRRLSAPMSSRASARCVAPVRARSVSARCVSGVVAWMSSSARNS